MAEESGQDKTEEPTAQRLKKPVKTGKLRVRKSWPLRP